MSYEFELPNLDNLTSSSKDIAGKNILSLESVQTLQAEWDWIKQERRLCYSEFCKKIKNYVNLEVKHAYIQLCTNFFAVDAILAHSPVYEEDYVKVASQLKDNYKCLQLKMSECEVRKNLNVLWKPLKSCNSVTSQDNLASSSKDIAGKNILSWESVQTLQAEWDWIKQECRLCYSEFCKKIKNYVNLEVNHAYIQLCTNFFAVDAILAHSPVYEEDYVKVASQLKDNYKCLQLKMSECEMRNNLNVLWKPLKSCNSVTSQDNLASSSKDIAGKNILSWESVQTLQAEWHWLKQERKRCYSEFCNKIKNYINLEVKHAYIQLCTNFYAVDAILAHSPVYEEDYVKVASQLKDNYKCLQLKMTECEVRKNLTELWKPLKSCNSENSQVQLKQKMKDKNV